MKEEISKALLNFNPAFSEDELEFGLSFFEEKEFKASSLICKAESSANRVLKYCEKINQQML